MAAPRPAAAPTRSLSSGSFSALRGGWASDPWFRTDESDGGRERDRDLVFRFLGRIWCRLQGIYLKRPDISLRLPTSGHAPII